MSYPNWYMSKQNVDSDSDSDSEEEITGFTDKSFNAFIKGMHEYTSDQVFEVCNLINLYNKPFILYQIIENSTIKQLDKFIQFLESKNVIEQCDKNIKITTLHGNKTLLEYVIKHYPDKFIKLIKYGFNKLPYNHTLYSYAATLVGCGEYDIYGKKLDTNKKYEKVLTYITTEMPMTNFDNELYNIIHDKHQHFNKDGYTDDQLRIMYGIANLYYKYDIVDSLYNELYKDESNERTKKIQEDRDNEIAVYKPLWIYNIKEIKQYVIDLYKSIPREDIVYRDEVTRRPENISNWKTYEYDNKIWLKKDGIDRYFGAKHLEKHNAPVVKKKILLKREGERIKVDVIISSRGNGKNPIQVKFKKIHTLSEFTPLEKNDDYTQCNEYKKYGFYDIVGNCELSSKTKENVIMDTETDKNFFDREFCEKNTQFLMNSINSIYGPLNEPDRTFSFVISLKDIRAR